MNDVTYLPSEKGFFLQSSTSKQFFVIFQYSITCYILFIMSRTNMSRKIQTKTWENIDCQKKRFWM